MTLKSYQDENQTKNNELEDDFSTENLTDNNSKKERWPDISTDIEQKLLPVPKMNKDMIPEPIRPWWEDVNERGVYPPEFTAIAIIETLATIIGANCHMRPKVRDNWSIVPNLWGLAVGEPGIKKTSALNEAKVFLDTLKQEATSDEKETQFSQNRFYTCDATVEKLGELLSKNQRGMLLFRDEISGFFSHINKRGHESDTAFFLEGWNGSGSYQVDRIGRGSIFIDNMCISILGGIQPEPLAKYVRSSCNKNGNDGMIQRFQLLVYPDAPEWRYVDKKQNEEAKSRLSNIFTKLANFNYSRAGVKKDERGYAYLHFSDSAQAIYISWIERLHKVKIKKEKDPLIQQHLTKYDKLIPSLALIFYLIKFVNRPVSGGAVAVDEESLHQAIAWGEFLEQHMRRVYAMCYNKELKSAANLLMQKINLGKLASGFTVRDVYRNHWQGLRDIVTIKAACDRLVELGWLRARSIQPNNFGRPTTRYDINPYIRK